MAVSAKLKFQFFPAVIGREVIIQSTSFLAFLNNTILFKVNRFMKSKMKM